MFIPPSKQLTSNIPVFNLKEKEEFNPINRKGKKGLISINQYQQTQYKKQSIPISNEMTRKKKNLNRNNLTNQGQKSSETLV